MKTEGDKLNKISQMRKLKIIFIPFKIIKMLAFRKCIIIIIIRMSPRLYKQKILKVHADGCKWMKTKRSNIEELIINKFKKDSREQGQTHLIWTAAKLVLELLINLSCKCHPAQLSLHFQALFNNRMNYKEEIVITIYRFKMINVEKILLLKIKYHLTKYINSLSLKKSMKIGKMIMFTI